MIEGRLGGRSGAQQSVPMTYASRHNDDGSTICTLDPTLSDVELQETLSMFGLPAMICTLNNVHTIPIINGNPVFSAFKDRLHALQVI